MRHKDFSAGKVIAITVSTRLYGYAKYTVSTVKIYRDGKGIDHFSVRYTIASGNDKEYVTNEAKRVANVLKVPYISNIKNNMKVYEILAINAVGV